MSEPADRVQRCRRPRPPSEPPSEPPCARCWRPRSTRSAGRSGRVRSRWPRRSRGAWTTSGTCSSRPAPAPASRWPTSCPALLHDRRVVVATATLALQHQLVERDLPRADRGGRRHPTREVDTSYAVLKGRSNYACLHRIREGVPDDQGALVELPEGSLGRRCSSCATWVEKEAEAKGQRRARPRARATPTASGDRSASATASASGPRSCPFGEECFAERAREKAHRSHLDRHQPLAARDRRDRGRADDPRLRRRGGRRGPRARQPGDAGGDRRAVRRRGRPGRAAFPALGQRQATKESRPPTTSPTPATRSRAAIDDSEPGRFDTRPRGPGRRPRAGPRRRAGLPLGVPQGADGPRPTPAGPRPAAPCRRSSSPPSGWPPARRPTCCG